MKVNRLFPSHFAQQSQLASRLDSISIALFTYTFHNERSSPLGSKQIRMLPDS
jgi:hypothetical protein